MKKHPKCAERCQFAKDACVQHGCEDWCVYQSCDDHEHVRKIARTVRDGRDRTFKLMCKMAIVTFGLAGIVILALDYFKGA